MKYAMYLILGMSLILQSCSSHMSVLTNDMVEDYGWSENDLRQMQFYLSEDIVLQKIQSGGMTDIKDGKVQVTQGKKVDEIVLKEGTPGVLVFMPESDRLGI